jgi:hypothetical protein
MDTLPRKVFVMLEPIISLTATTLKYKDDYKFVSLSFPFKPIRSCEDEYHLGFMPILA